MKWFSGSGKRCEFETIIETVRKHSSKNGKIFIGCDSQIIRDRCIFSTVICLHGAENQKGGYYYFSREKLKDHLFQPCL